MGLHSGSGGEAHASTYDCEGETMGAACKSPAPPDVRWIGAPPFMPMDEAQVIVKEFRLH
jgi:hypothetical protein